MEESNEKNTGDVVCTKCGLPKSRPGTVTAWIFQTSYCSCRATIQDSLPISEHEDFDLPLLGTRYKVLNPLGRGGVANVYKVQDSVTMKILAAKVMLRELAANDLAVKRFQKEVEVLADLSHKNLVKIHGYAMDRNGVPYLIMDYVDGSNLEELIKSGGPLVVQRAVDLFMQICTGLSYVHDNGIIHRDLKPSNVIVSSKPGSHIDHVTVIDFGFAKIVDGARDSRLTSTGESFGSPCYMSPEHCLGQELDARSDIYSFGCLMYQALCGKPPVEGENALATVAKQVKGDVVSLRKVNPNVPKNLNTVIMQCLEKEPSLRYQNVDDVERDLIRVLSGKPVLAQSQTQTRERERGTDARWWSASSQHILLNRWVAIFTLVVLVIGSGMIGAFIASNSASRTSTAETVRQDIKPLTPPIVRTPTVRAPSVIVPTFKPLIKAPHEVAPKIEKIAPLRNLNETIRATKSPPQKVPNRMLKAKMAKKQSDAERARWLKWLETQKLRKLD